MAPATRAGTSGAGPVRRRATAPGHGSRPAGPASRIHEAPYHPGGRVSRIVLFVGAVRPVLKHGPRSLTWVRVVGWQTLVRREIEIALAFNRVHGWQRVVLLFSA